MADLKTSYMGIGLDNPVVVSSSGITGSLKGVKRCADAGAGAVVLKSMFEEIIAAQAENLDSDLVKSDHPEAWGYVTAELGMQMGSKPYLKFIGEAKKAVSIPVIASVNCVTAKWWVPYAQEIEDTGADGDGDGVNTCMGDCDDQDPYTYPGATEICDGLDNDCDGAIPADEADDDSDGDLACDDCDDADPTLHTLDLDGDFFSPCEGDCDDTHPAINPFANDVVGDGIDQNCDGLDGVDADGDGYAAQFTGGDDCDDGDPALNLDDVDGDGGTTCDGDCDDSDAALNLTDVDGDGWNTCDEDCDDTVAAIHPAAPDVCDGNLDNDCDGIADAQETDDDGDGASECDGDCDDTDAAIQVGAEEVCDGVDNDCDPTTDEEVDFDGDGYALCAGDCDESDESRSPAAFETCNGLDDDCDGQTDEACVTCTIEVPGDYSGVAAAVSAASSGDIVCVGPGTYSDNVDTAGKALHVLGVAGAGSTLVDGGGWGSVFTMDTGEGAGTVVQGLTVTGGSASSGGGFYIEAASPTLSHLVVTANSATYGGGLFMSSNASPSLSHVDIVGNTGTQYGGGLNAYQAHPTLTDVVIAGNSSAQGGGIVAYWYGSLVLDHVLVTDNSATAYGGGMAISTSTTVTATHLVVANNTSTSLGGGIYACCSASVTVDNGAVVGNAAMWGGGICEDSGAHITLDSAVLIDNQASSGGGGVFSTNGTVYFTYSDVWGNTPEDVYGITHPAGVSGNLSVDPLFIDTTPVAAYDWDLHLDEASPLVNAGNAAFSNPDGTRCDMGAYGGPSAGDWDLDHDGHPEWWQPGEYDVGVYPGDGWDCDDRDPLVGPEWGC